MGRKILTEVYCKGCKKNIDRDNFLLRKKGSRKGHLTSKYCKSCDIKRIRSYGENDEYRQHKLNQCRICGFEGHPCQLDVNHIDGNHMNNNLINLETLCANCHRLVTFYQRGSE